MEQNSESFLINKKKIKWTLTSKEICQNNMRCVSRCLSIRDITKAQHVQPGVTRYARLDGSYREEHGPTKFIVDSEKKVDNRKDTDVPEEPDWNEDDNHHPHEPNKEIGIQAVHMLDVLIIGFENRERPREER